MATVERNRQTIRWLGYDYSQSGAYFVTICTFEREEIFGRINDGASVLNEYGRIVESQWLDLPSHHPGIGLDECVVMPNHVHFIFWIHDAFNFPVGATPALPLQHHPALPLQHTDTCNSIVGATQALPLHGPCPRSVGSIVGSFKSSVSKRIHKLQKYPHPIWQRNYFERVIRSESELRATRRYIRENPIQWEFDRK